MNRQRESRGGRVVAATGTGRLSPSQQPRGFLARLRFRFRPARVLAGFARNGLIVALAVACGSFLMLAAAPRKPAQPRPNVQPARHYLHLDRATHMPDAAWGRVAMTPAQKAKLKLLENKLLSEQRQTLRRIGPKAAVLRRELQTASTTPGQEVRAVKLRQEILRLTLPLQEQHAAFVKKAKTLLTPAQRRNMESAGAQVKAAQAAARRLSGKTTAGGAR